MNIITFFIIVCLMAAVVAIIGCLACNIKSKRQPLPVGPIGKEFYCDCELVEIEHFKTTAIPFEAECERFDNWVSETYNCSYDGEEFTNDADWFGCE